MPVKDYNADPDLNTQISGINIAEGCAPSGINNAIRQLMADVKEEFEGEEGTVSSLETALRSLIAQEVAKAMAAANAAQSSADAKLPLAGGVMLGAVQWPYGCIFFQDYGPYILGLEGSSAEYKGAGIYLFNGYDNGHPGAVQIATRHADGTYGPQAWFNRDGSAQWNGKNLVRSVNGVNADTAGNASITTVQNAVAYPNTTMALCRPSQTIYAPAGGKWRLMWFQCVTGYQLQGELIDMAGGGAWANRSTQNVICIFIRIE